MLPHVDKTALSCAVIDNDTLKEEACNAGTETVRRQSTSEPAMTPCVAVTQHQRLNNKSATLLV